MAAAEVLRHSGAMDVETLMARCAELPGAWPDDPWDHEYPVFKVGPGDRGKIFAFCGAAAVGVKCGATREVADEWLARFPGDASVMAYIGRSGWNDLRLSGAIADDELVTAVEDSYRAVVSKLPVKHRPEGWDRVGEP